MYFAHTNYILLDAEYVEIALEMAKAINPNHQSLYRTREGAEEISPDEAPYLFTWPHSDEFSSLFLQEGWGQSWGVLIKSCADFKTLYQHLRRFLTVQLEGGAQVRFRFYDPRVLRIFLPTCDSIQLKEFFGPVEKFICEDEKSSFGLVFTSTNSQLKIERIPKEMLLNPVPNSKMKQIQYV